MPKIIQTIVDQMLVHAKREAPYECCGILAGRVGCEGIPSPITELYEIKNLSPDDPRIAELKIPEDRTVRYMMDPGEQFCALRNMRERDLAMMGIYHSHPHSAALPSETDIRLAFYPEVFYFIISLAQTVPDLRAFLIVGGKTTEEKIAIVEPC
jgi:proteasome lid subunit RPN8/RPN11